MVAAACAIAAAPIPKAYAEGDRAVPASLSVEAMPPVDAAGMLAADHEPPSRAVVRTFPLELGRLQPSAFGDWNVQVPLAIAPSTPKKLR